MNNARIIGITEELLYEGAILFHMILLQMRPHHEDGTFLGYD
jgi:hypothetical protein